MSKNKMSIDFSGFAEYAEKLDKLGGDLKAVFDDALQQAAETYAADTLEATNDRFMPAKGKYSNGDTAESVIKENEVQVQWNGNIGEVGIGFDLSKSITSIFLIDGTPKMNPNRELKRIYRGTAYKNRIIEDMQEIFMDAIEEKMEGK